MSRSGTSDDTVTVVATDAIFIAIVTSVFVPRFTTTFDRSTVANPDSSVFTVYVPGANPRNRKSPCVPDVSVNGALTPVSVTVTPGSTPPDSSVTRP